MTKVHRYSQEYWAVTPMKCRCGTAFIMKSAGIKRLHERQSVHVDALRVRCESCGREADLEFDISPWLGEPDVASFRRVLGDQRTLREMYGWPELGMGGVLKYFSELSASGDLDALEFLIDAAGHYL